MCVCSTVRRRDSATLTEAGQRAFERLGPALGEIDAGLDVLSGLRDNPAGTLRLKVPVMIARVDLPPIASREPFSARAPRHHARNERRRHLHRGSGRGLRRGHIRYEERVEREMIAVPIGPRVQRCAAAAAPAYRAAQRTPRHPRELTAHGCIRHRFASGATADWEFKRGTQTVRIRPAGPRVAHSLEMQIAAAVAGLGVIATFEEGLRESMRRGGRIPGMPQWWLGFSGPFLYYPSRRHMPGPRRAFDDFIRGDAGRAAAP